MSTIISWLFFSYLSIFPFGQLGRVEFANDITLHLIDIVSGLFGVVGLYGLAKGILKTPPLSRHFFLFFAVASFSLLVNLQNVKLDQFFVGFLYLLRLAAYFFFYASLWNLFRESIWQERLPKLLLVVGIVTAALGYLQYFFIPDLRSLTEYGWDPHLYRLAGTFLDTGFMGVILAMFALLVVAKIWGLQFTQFKKSREGKYLLPFFLILVVGLALTYSRASYLAYLAGVAVIYIVRRNIIWLVFSTLALFLVIPFLPRPEGEGVRLERTSTIAHRVNSYGRSLEVVREYPLFGVGYNLYRYTQTDISLHGASGVDSSLLLVLATTGVTGFFVFSQLIWQVFVYAWSQRRNVLGLMLVSSLGVVFIDSFFDNSLFYPWVLGWLFILLAAV